MAAAALTPLLIIPSSKGIPTIPPMLIPLAIPRAANVPWAATIAMKCDRCGKKSAKPSAAAICGTNRQTASRLTKNKVVKTGSIQGLLLKKLFILPVFFARISCLNSFKFAWVESRSSVPSKILGRRALICLGNNNLSSRLGRVPSSNRYSSALTFTPASLHLFLLAILH